MTSPRQRKKRLAALRLKEQQEKSKQTQETKQEVVTSVAAEPSAVVVSEPVAKTKKSKSGLVELKSQDQVVEQPKEEVKTPTKE